MPINDELLTAYVDGELDAATNAAVERAIAADSSLGERVAQHRRLREQLRATFDRALQEPIPAQLLHTLSQTPQRPGPAEVIDFSRVRAARRGGARPDFTLPRWTAIAASLVIGVCAGIFAQRLNTGDASTEYRNGAWFARAALARALNEQLASSAASNVAMNTAGAHVGLSFKEKSGDYCRTFIMNERQSFAGLACRQNGDWRLAALVSVDSQAGGVAGNSPSYRMASSALPAALAQAVTERIAGEPLDAQAEAAARQRGWQ